MDRSDPNFDEDAILRTEYKKFFEDGIIENDSENIGNQLYRISILNNIAQQPGMFFNSRAKCELCDKDHKDNCDFDSLDERSKIGRVSQLLGDRHFVLVVQWRSHPQANM